MEKTKILVYGAGAVGIFFGGQLFKAGFDVVFLDRTEKVERLGDNGFCFRSLSSKEFCFRPEVVDNVNNLPPQDLILVCVKAFQTYEIAMNLLPCIKPSTIVLSLQNGLENEKIIADLIGKNMIMGCVPYFDGYLSSDWTVEQHAPAEIVFGELDYQPSDREGWLSALFTHGGINHRIVRNITENAWEKFIWNTTFNSISALTQSSLNKITESAEILGTLRQMMMEVHQVAHKEGVELPPQNIEELLTKNLGFGHMRSVTLQDIERGHIPELESLMKGLLERAKIHDVSTPVYRTVYNLIRLSLSNRNLGLIQ